MHIFFSDDKSKITDTIIVFVDESLKLKGKTADVDKELGGAIQKLIKNDKITKDKSSIELIKAPANVDYDTVIVASFGKKKDITDLNIQKLGGKIYSSASSNKSADIFLFIDNEKQAANIAYGMKLKSYFFDKYKTKEKKEDKPSIKNVNFILDAHKKADENYKELKKIANGVFFARDLVTEPPNVLYPESYAELCENKLAPLGVEIKILGEKDMDQLGMGALLGVGQGSIRESKMVVMKWNGAEDPNEQPIAFVGKGVTFDTGGISLKPSGGMEDMKYDMGGSATVAGLIKALAGRKAKVNAVGVIGLVENMPGHNAQRPSDIVNTMSGQTVEVLNTDAEGRLVLADALWYTQDKFSPKIMINLATLTGAIVIALGNEHAGLFSNNDKLSSELLKAGLETEEKLWRFPIDKVGEGYDKLIDSKIADIQNISSGRGAGSITAAQFLQRFVNDVPWAHLDIAGVAWAKKANDITPEGGAGYGVRLLDRFVADNYEN